MPDIGSSALQLRMVASTLSFVNLSSLIFIWATMLKCPASKNPRLGFPVFLRGLWLFVTQQMLSNCSIALSSFSCITSNTAMRNLFSTGPFLVLAIQCPFSSLISAIWRPFLPFLYNRLPKTPVFSLNLTLMFSSHTLSTSTVNLGMCLAFSAFTILSLFSFLKASSTNWKLAAESREGLNRLTSNPCSFTSFTFISR